MKKNYLVGALGIMLCTISVGCSTGNTNGQTPSANQSTVTYETEPSTIEPASTIRPADTKKSEEAVSEYSYLAGLWTTDGKEKEEIIENGGTYVTLTVTKGNKVTGTVTSIQEISQRIASVDFEGTIVNGSLIYYYSEDGFENMGVLTMNVTSDFLSIENSVQERGLESPNWQIASATLYKKN